MRLIGLVALLAACGASKAIDGNGPDATPSPDTDAVPANGLPPSNAAFDYQLGGAYTPPTGVSVVSRDRTDQPAAGLYNICYLNGFQIQPDEANEWMTDHPDLILRDSAGAPVIDKDWNEILIDVSTASKRAEVAMILGGWIDGCKTSGFDAVEIDNLDSYSRSNGLLTVDDAVATMAMFAASAHTKGLPIAQKNASEIVARKAELGTDFAVVEECNHYDECQTFRDGYGDHMLVIEYARADFTKGCNAFPSLSIVLRDRDLVTPEDPAYVFDDC